ncbi:MAG TPA: 50S ribosomal protein L24 [Acidimicrobiia bacterium]|jgi:large subunit ribosomal protein L24|nr:50S ribosomal protein L24 [Acidimicrobiia bacterium]
MKLRKGDEVEVLSGKELGKRGDIMRVLPRTNKVIIDRVNLAKKHQKPTRSTMQGGIIDKEMPLHASNVGIVCKSCHKPTRIGYRFDDDGKKIRICRKCEGDL